MPRISQEVIDRLKSEVSVERLAEAMGIKLHRHGADLIGLCRFHDDHEPSLVVSPKKNLWHCLGKCQAGGSSIDWVMRAQGVSFRHAVELMREDMELVSTAPLRPVKVSTVRRLEAFDAEATDKELLAQVVGFYHETLKESAEALGYLKSRGLDSSEMIERFKLGYSNRTLGYRIPASNRQAGEAIRGRLEKLGIIRDSGHEHFSGSLVIPIFDEAGQVTEVYGRKVTPNLRKGTPLHLYLPGPHEGVFNLDALKTSKEIILCEALIDALTFWCHGFKNVTASYGVSGFTPDHLEAMKRHGTKTVLIAYDRDDAGDKAAETLAEKLVALGIGCYRVQFPRGMDANDYARKIEPAEKALGVVLRSAVWLGGPASRAPAALISLVAAKEEAASSPREARVTVAIVEAAAASEAPAAGTVTTPATPPEPAPVATAESREDELVIAIEDRRYRVRGLPEVLAFDHLHANVFAGRNLGAAGNAPLASGFHVERFDLYSRTQRQAFAKEVAIELRLLPEQAKKDLGAVLLKVEEHLEAKKREKSHPKPPVDEMSPEARAEALELLRAPDLLSRILKDFERAGIVGEETNKLVGYLGVVSRKLKKPLAVIVQSSSAAGKSSLMEAVLSFVPPEDRVKYSAMTGQALFYHGEGKLKHKVLAIVEEEGAERASYALKLLQSEGELTIASTGKDAVTGRLETQEYRVEGPVMIFETTTKADLDEELANRSIVLTVNEDREQTRAIHKLQRESQTLEGVLAQEEREEIRTLHMNAQRLLRPLRVVNPYARDLTFLDDRTRTRRDHEKYLTLILAAALLRQHQREVKTTERKGKLVEHIEATLDDIAVANRLAHEVLGRSLDELGPQTRRVLTLVDELVKKRAEGKRVHRSAIRFSRREVREHTGLSLEQVRIHLGRLVELEYLIVHRGGRGLGFEYELSYDGQGQDGRAVLFGLIDVTALAAAHGYDLNLPGSLANLPALNTNLPATYRAATGQVPGTYRPPANGSSPHEAAKIAASPSTSLENTHRDEGRGPRHVVRLRR